MPRLSVIIIARDEEKMIEDCLKAVKWADEIVVVVDDRTTDKTAAMAKKYTDRVFLNKFKSFGKQKQFALEKASGDWVLSLDADERITPELKKEILKAIQTKRFSCYHTFFQEVYLTKLMPFQPIGGTERLFKREKGFFTQALVHERVIVKGKVGALKNPIVHHSGPTLAKIISKFNRFTDLEAEMLVKAGAKFSLFYLLFVPAYKFIERLIFHRHYRWGFRGVIYAFLAGFYSFLKQAKIWELEQD